MMAGGSEDIGIGEVERKSQSEEKKEVKVTHHDEDSIELPVNQINVRIRLPECEFSELSSPDMKSCKKEDVDVAIALLRSTPLSELWF